MNANELADAMEIRASIRRKATSRKSVQENTNDRLADQLDEAATMLRQQQAEIEALKQMIDANNLNQNIGQFVKPTNEPVAWMNRIGDIILPAHQANKEYNIPLYTHQYERPHNTVLVPCDKLAEMQAEIETLKAHPVKELTDEEILDVAGEFPFIENGTERLNFARAILLKAQEK